MAARHRGPSERSGRPLGANGGGRGRLWPVARRVGTVLLAAGLTLASGTSLAPALGPARYQAVVTPAAVGNVAGQVHTAARTAAVNSAPAATDAHYPAVVSLTSMTPSNGTYTFTGTVLNSGSTPISDLHVGIRVDPDRLGTRGQIAATAGLTTPQATDPPELDAPRQLLGTLPPGATSASFSLVVKVSDMNLSSNDGVFAIAVDAMGNLSGSGSGSTSPQDLGITRTFLPLFGAPGDKPTQIATLWPVVDTPRLQPQTYTDTQQTDQPVLANDDLAGELGADGRLGQLQILGSGIAALKPTWVIDPDLVSTVVAMAGNYRVATGDDTKGANALCKCTQLGSGSDAAASWLKQMETALTGLDSKQVISLPAGDPDIASIARNGTVPETLATSLKAASSDLGQIGLNPLQVSANHSVAWPYQGYLDRSVVSLAHSMGASQIVANSTSLPDSLTYTPNAARSLGNGMTAVAADSTISDIFSADLSTQNAQILAEQRFLAETLAITEEQPSNQRSILVQPPRYMSASTAQTLATALKAAVDGKWVTPVSYSTVAQAAPSKDAGTSIAPYPASAAASQLGADSLSTVQGIQQHLADLEPILSHPDKVNNAFNAAVLRSVSTQWRNQAQAGADYRDNTKSYLASLQGAVSILLPQGATVTLPGNGRAKIPITVGNDLPQSVLKLEVRLTSTAPPARLMVDDPDTQSVTAQGNTKPTVRFTVTASANGQYQMVAQLYTTAGNVPQPYGDAVQFTVDVTSLPSGVIAVMVGGGLLVVLAVLRMYWKRRKNVALLVAEASGAAEAPQTGQADGKTARQDERNAP